MSRVCAAALASALVAAGCTGSPPPLRTILLVTVDTLRADALHSYGFPQAVTPGSDALAARGVVFDRAIAASSSTIPSHASIMTSRYARRHSAGARNGDTRLEGLDTLAQRFDAAGFATAAFVSNLVLQRRSGLDSGFAHYDERLPTVEESRRISERRADDTVDAALAWLAEQTERRVFLWVHLQDPHGPYTPPEGWLERVEPLTQARNRALQRLQGDGAPGGIPPYQYIEGVTQRSDYLRRYAAEVAYADHAIARLADAALGREPAALLLTSDHGESLGEGGFYFQHAHATTPELARIPFILVAPGLAPERRADLVHHVDVAPTLLELAGLPALVDSAGVALAPYLRERRALPERIVFCDTLGEAGAYGLRSYTRLRFPGRDRVAAVAREDGVESDDPAPVQSRASGLREGPDGRWRPGVDARIEQQLRDYVRGQVPSAPASLNDETLERLRALGYLGEGG